MDYNLAKELKDAGFPQNGTFDGYLKITDIIDDDPDLLYPTLEGLIKSCGDNFGGILKRKGTDTFHCGKPEDKIPYCLEEYPYSSPEEAVARLWLNLNN